MRSARLRPVLSILALCALSACSTLGALGDATTPLSVYELRAPEGAPVARGAALARDVIVELPTTSGVLSTDRILIRPNALEAQYLPEVRWGDEVPVMLQTLMLRALVNTGGVRYVGRRPLAGAGDFAIVTELVDFQAEVAADGESALVTMNMTSRMVRERDASIIASRTFTASALAPSTETTTIIAAFDTASDALLLDFAEWTMGALGKRLVPAS
ncbi:ABC-type transport auxiliary lipoprotein family protein [Cognatishimia sp. F0-27]|uniref:ABC-type transport auxiliary lipoprotein family protein n=1 Tax=Cognatishimia sp. F0-27 TaxID=2816855 RepID=UPI001D0C7537|nr:ABC-type transport auxiliary lipoprotein family protein [Cognatishimia sp. F0-27]MCC1493753.1 membrane integrity-associated transporter subunit PqiC [Cognatishimia sp. F0-27]